MEDTDDENDRVRITGVTVKDLADGRYMVTYLAKFVGKYEIKHLKDDIVSLEKFTSDLIADIFVRVKDDSWTNEKQIKVLMSVKEALLKAESRSSEISLMHQKQQKTECEKMSHIANVFECLREMDLSKQIVSEVRDILKEFRILWELHMKVLTVIDDAKKIRWDSLDSESFEDSAKSLVVMLRRLTKGIKSTDAYKGLEKMIKDYVKEFKLPSKNLHMTLKDLLELNLHTYANDVEEIAEKAGKEAKHEETLRNLESTWSSVQFSMNFYKDTDIPLLKLEDDAVEQLESDQMAVQSIMGSRYNYFKAQAGEWQKALALLTAIKQVTARKNRLPLDKMSLDTHVTRMTKISDTLANATYPEDGIFVHG
eukprot:gene2683-2625_t